MHCKSLEAYSALVAPANLKPDSSLVRLPAQHPPESGMGGGLPHPQNDDKPQDKASTKLIWSWAFFFFFPATDNEFRPMC